MKVPSFLLKRLYVKGSLRNTDDGFEFRISNTLGSGYAQAISPVRVDGEELPAEQSSFTADGKTQAFPEVDKDNPASLAMNREAIVSVRGHTLPPGAHTVTMGFTVAGLGEISFDLVDTIEDA